MILLPQDRILFKRVDIEQKSKGGLILSATEVGEGRDVAYGEVLVVGEGKYVDGGFRPTISKPGDIITFNDRMPLKWIYKGEELALIRESDVLSILRDEDLTITKFSDVAHDFRPKERVLG